MCAFWRPPFCDVWLDKVLMHRLDTSHLGVSDPCCATTQAGVVSLGFVCCGVQLGDILQVLVALMNVTPCIEPDGSVFSNRTCLCSHHVVKVHCT